MRISVLVPLLVGLLCLAAPGGGEGAVRGSAASATAAAEPPWEEVLSPPRKNLPFSRGKLVWFENLERALAVARREDRPVFVTLRCVAAPSFAEFDAQVLTPKPALRSLLDRFVTVRLVTVHDVDTRYLPLDGYMDFDASWWGWFLSPEGRLYGVYGGRDHRSDTSVVSETSLATALDRVLRHHAHPDREAWDVDGPAPDPQLGPRTPLDLPGFVSWGRRQADLGQQGCMRCHQIPSILRQPDVDRRRFVKGRDVSPWPYPENVGIELARDEGLRILQVQRNSPAWRAGLRGGDELGVADGRLLLSQTDLRAALERGPREAGKIELIWMRLGEVHRGIVRLPEKWRTTPLRWRWSIALSNIGAHPGFDWATPVSERERERNGLEHDTMALRPSFGARKNWLALRAGLQPSDVILAVDDFDRNIGGVAFFTWFRMRYEPGDMVTLKIRRGRNPLEIRYRVGRYGHGGIPGRAEIEKRQKAPRQRAGERPTEPGEGGD